jgi:hypothetical protein
LNEIRTIGRGIVLMHERSGSMDASNHDIDNGTGNIVDLVKYVVPILEGEGFTFKSIIDVPNIAADLPKCHPSCATCSGPTDAHCLSCPAGNFVFAGRCTPCSTCKAGTYQATACQTGADTVCSPCDKSCTVCAGPDVKQCNTCQTGFFVQGTVCSACAVCPAGTFIAEACAPTFDTECRPCAAGTFSATASAATCTACAAGTFSTGSAPSCQACGSCDDGNACTADSCSPTGCVHTPIPGCTPPANPTNTKPDGGEASSDVPEDGGGCSIVRPNRGSPVREGSAVAMLFVLASAVRRRRR